MINRQMFAALLFTVAAGAVIQGGDAKAADGRTPESLGRVNFPNTCDAAVQSQFERGIALLHSFWFPEALKTFNDVLKADPGCTLAYWGIGVNRLLNPFGGQPAEKVLLQGQAAVDQGLKVTAKSQRERDYLEAIATLYVHDKSPWRERVLSYEKAMEQLTQRYPDDKEAAIFYALALNVASVPTDKTFAKQLKAAAILEPIFAAQPDHPGAAHYLIHSYDYPPIAEKGLKAARSYADIAPAAAHALHMPSHIFTRVGAWEDSVATNLRSEATARKNNTPDEILHAIDYQVYALLQLAQDTQAMRTIERAQAEAARFERNAGAYALAAVSARYPLERGDWRAAAQIAPRPSKFPYTDAMIFFARALGAARSGNPAAARKDIAELTRLRDELESRKDNYWKGEVEVQRLAAEAWTLQAEGSKAEALAMMRQSADMEDKSEKAPVTPGRVMPARELLGEMLLEQKQPALALQEFEASATRDPNRFRGYYGAALAASQSGDTARAKTYFAKLAQLGARGDARPELQQAKMQLSRN